MKTMLVILTLTFAVSAGLASKKPHPKVTKDQAVRIVRKQVKGAVIQTSELEKEEGKLIWSFDLRVAGATREVWVDANSGKIIKDEKESAAAENAERTSDQAERAALRKIPGKVVKNSAKIKQGKMISAVQILTKSGRVVEVDVEQKTNKVVAVQTMDAPGKE
jgi:uncharacterized membrane protein YkoI